MLIDIDIVVSEYYFAYSFRLDDFTVPLTVLVLCGFFFMVSSWEQNSLNGIIIIIIIIIGEMMRRRRRRGIEGNLLRANFAHHAVPNLSFFSSPLFVLVCIVVVCIHKSIIASKYPTVNFFFFVFFFEILRGIEYSHHHFCVSRLLGVVVFVLGVRV